MLLLLFLINPAAAALVIDATDGLSVSSLTSTLKNVRANLAASSSVLAEVERQHAAGFDISADDLARETLLSSRIVTGLSNVCIKTSELTGAGDGLFATRDIAEGEILTCYPGDAVVALPPGMEPDEAMQPVYGQDRVLIWGTHVALDLRNRATNDMAACVASNHPRPRTHQLSVSPLLDTARGRAAFEFSS